MSFVSFGGGVGGGNGGFVAGARRRWKRVYILLIYNRNVSYVSYVSLFTRAARHVFCIYFTFLIINFFY